MSPRLGEGTLEQVLGSAIRSSLLETHTFLPGVIEAFDATTVRASVRIPLKRLTEDLDGVRTEHDWPLLADLPVVFPHAAGFAITMPVTVGDEVLVGFLERDASKWLEAGVGKVAAKHQIPETLRIHDLGDGVVLVGMNTKPSQITSYSTTAVEIRGPEGNPVFSMSSSGVAMTVLTNELWTVLEELCDAITALQTIAAAPTANESITPATATAIAAVKTKLTAMKA